MLIQTWAFVGALAVLVSGLAVLTSDDGLAIMTGVAGFILWGVFTFGALNLERATRCCIQTFSYPSVALIGIMLSLGPGYIALTGPVNIISRVRDPSSDEL